MLKTPVIHPEILEALAAAGHGSQVLIADGDYPVSTTKGIHTKIVHLNLVPGKMQATEVLDALLQILPVEDARVMDVPQGVPKPKVWDVYTKMFTERNIHVSISRLERFSFYEEVGKANTVLIIQTGETRDYANLLLTVGSLW